MIVQTPKKTRYLQTVALSEYCRHFSEQRLLFGYLGNTDNRSYMMIYEYLFGFFDSIPTVDFIVYFLLGYLSTHFVVYRLLLVNNKFRTISYDKQSSILVSIMECSLLAFMR